MEKTAVIIVICAAILWLMIRKPVVAVTRAANQVGGTAGSIGASAAGASGILALGSLIGGAVKGWTSPAQPAAAAPISGSSSVGLGNTSPVSDDDLLNTLDG